MSKRGGTFEEKIVRVVCAIPRGKVSTYGQIAAICGAPRAARQVGRVLHGLPPLSKVPWQRVLNCQGRISIIHEHITASVQAQLLKEDGLEITENDGSYRVDLKTYLWQPDRIEARK